VKQSSRNFGMREAFLSRYFITDNSIKICELNGWKTENRNFRPGGCSNTGGYALYLHRRYERGEMGQAIPENPGNNRPGITTMMTWMSQKITTKHQTNPLKQDFRLFFSKDNAKKNTTCFLLIR
jgi:hypothetical protein